MNGTFEGAPFAAAAATRTCSSPTTTACASSQPKARRSTTKEETGHGSRLPLPLRARPLGAGSQARTDVNSDQLDRKEARGGKTIKPTRVTSATPADTSTRYSPKTPVCSPQTTSHPYVPAQISATSRWPTHSNGTATRSSARIEQRRSKKASTRRFDASANRTRLDARKGLDVHVPVRELGTTNGHGQLRKRRWRIRGDGDCIFSVTEIRGCPVTQSCGWCPAQPSAAPSTNRSRCRGHGLLHAPAVSPSLARVRSHDDTDEHGTEGKPLRLVDTGARSRRLEPLREPHAAPPTPAHFR